RRVPSRADRSDTQNLRSTRRGSAGPAYGTRSAAAKSWTARHAEPKHHPAVLVRAFEVRFLSARRNSRFTEADVLKAEAMSGSRTTAMVFCIRFENRFGRDFE